MANPIVLLGRPLDVRIEPGAEDDVDEVLPVIQGAADVLNAQNDRGQLDALAIRYLGALRGLGVGLGRSFTPCKGTADEDLGLYVYFMGKLDVDRNADPLWWASTMIHDGGHAWLSQNGQPATGVAVEQALTKVQIDYYNAVGGRPTYVANLEGYMADAGAIQARIVADV